MYKGIFVEKRNCIIVLIVLIVLWQFTPLTLKNFPKMEENNGKIIWDANKIGRRRNIGGRKNKIKGRKNVPNLYFLCAKITDSDPYPDPTYQCFESGSVWIRII